MVWRAIFCHGVPFWRKNGVLCGIKAFDPLCFAGLPISLRRSTHFVASVYPFCRVGIPSHRGGRLHKYFSLVRRGAVGPMGDKTTADFRSATYGANINDLLCHASLTSECVSNQ